MKSEFDVKKENELIAKAQRGDIIARREVHRIFNRALNDSVYGKYSGLTQSLSAIRMEAEQILDKALDSYNPSFGVKPLTYFKTYVDNKLMRYVNDNVQPVRVVEKISLDTPKYRDSVLNLGNELGRTPTDEEVLSHMKKTYPKMQDLRVKDIQRFKKDIRTTSYGSTTLARGDEGANLTVEDITFAEGAGDPMESYMQELKAMEIRNKVMTLPEPHKTIILHWYGFNGYQKLSLRDLALKLGINKYRVQEYLKEAEALLKQ